MTPKFTPGQTAVIQGYIESHLHERITLRSLADLLGLPPPRFLMLFHATFGTTPRQYILGRKVRRAIWKLLHTTDSIASIAIDTGFSSHSHFTNRFRKVVGKSPQEFRSENSSAQGIRLFSGMAMGLAADNLTSDVGQEAFSETTRISGVDEKGSPSLMVGAEEILKAVRQGELRLHYQPQVVTHPRWKIRGVEALVRWMHPIHGLVQPSLFIPQAESMGLLREISVWVLREACLQIGMLRDMGLAIPNLSINISSDNLADQVFVRDIEGIVRNASFDPSALTLEVTENRPLQLDETTLQHIGRLREMGIKLAIDDFGAGYTGFNLLCSNAFDELKLDYLLIKDLETSTTARTLVASMVKLAGDLGMTVVAEGVETEGQARFLTSLPGVVLQGYAFSYPLTLNKLAKWLGADAQQEEGDSLSLVNDSRRP